MFLLIVIHQIALDYPYIRPKPFLKQVLVVDEINIFVVDYENSKSFPEEQLDKTKTDGCRLSACCLKPSHSSYWYPEQAHNEPDLCLDL